MRPSREPKRPAWPSGSNLQAEVSAFDKGATAPLETRHYLVEPGAENAFARAL